ncbi:hypothetical protein [Gordonia insulae]|uniref:DUF3298 domain-containing protein n=1 Tax=Gordonia insulae TaxID=2420509 RepID=A0A3G8JNS2_9ACTN|nr:hypothetical protein [Gordonia insulae]AZG46737.1 hypothetical protein D7316_03338 [Gordonia insulae]
MTSRRGGVATILLAVTVLAACGESTQTTSSNSPGQVIVTSSSTPPSSAAAPMPSPTPAAQRYVAASVPVTGVSGTTTVDVLLPQVTGGDAAVRSRFNSGMRAGLDDLIGNVGGGQFTVANGSLVTDERSRVTTITETVVAGVGIYMTNAPGAAHPNNHVATTTINASTAQPILLTDVFVDPAAAAQRLAMLVPRLDSRADPPQPAIDSFLNWVPLSTGFHIYVSVIHALGDYLPVTVPWDDISDLMKPGMAAVLGG